MNADWLSVKQKIIGKEFEREVRAVFPAYFAKKKGNWKVIGLHRSFLALGCGFFEREEKKQGLEFVKKHHLFCFSNDRDTFWLGAPDKDNPQLINVGFSHYAFPFCGKTGKGISCLVGTVLAGVGCLKRTERRGWKSLMCAGALSPVVGLLIWLLSVYELGLRRRYDFAPQIFEYVFWKNLFHLLWKNSSRSCKQHFGGVENRVGSASIFSETYLWDFCLYTRKRRACRDRGKAF